MATFTHHKEDQMSQTIKMLPPQIWHYQKAVEPRKRPLTAVSSEPLSSEELTDKIRAIVREELRRVR